MSVFSYCPGAFRSRISREAGLAGKLMTSFFIDAERAAWPALYCATSPEVEGRSELYLYLRHLTRPGPGAADPDHGARLWELSRALLGARDIELAPL